MIQKSMLFSLLLCLATALVPQEKPVECLIQTTLGDIVIAVNPEQAPITATNFIRYVDANLYDQTTFFRVVTLENQPDNAVKIEVIQGGDVPREKCFPPIAHETTQQTGLLHKHGTISMARGAPGTASSSFFICIHDQPELDCGGRRNPDGQGFAAFGQVISGMDVVERIQKLEADGQRLKALVPIITLRRQTKNN